MQTEKSLFDLQSQVESVQNLTSTIRQLKDLADYSLECFNIPPQKFVGVSVQFQLPSSYGVDLCKIEGSVVFEQWVVSHFIPALQHLCEMSIHEVHTLKDRLHHITRPEEGTPANTPYKPDAPLFSPHPRCVDCPPNYEPSGSECKHCSVSS